MKNEILLANKNLTIHKTFIQQDLNRAVINFDPAVGILQKKKKHKKIFASPNRLEIFPNFPPSIVGDFLSHPVYEVARPREHMARQAAESSFSVNMFSRSTIRSVGSQRQLITFRNIIYRDSLASRQRARPAEKRARAERIKRRGAGSHRHR